MTPRQQEIYDSTINLLIDSKKIEGIDPSIVESFAFGLYMAELLQKTSGNGSLFFTETFKVGAVLLRLTPDEMTNIFTEIELNGGPRS